MKLYKYLISLVVLACVFITEANGFEGFTVNKIQVEGLKSIAKEAVLRNVLVNLGDRITVSKAQAIIKSLYKTNFFQNIELERSGDCLVIRVVERPFISKIEITGIKSKEAITKILKDLKVAEGLVYDENLLRKVEQQIQNYYLMQGRYGVQVVSSTIKKSRNRMEIRLAITEGEEAKIAGIVINGNNKFSRAILLKQLTHAKTHGLSWLYKDDCYLKEKFDEDLEGLKSFYLNHGYMNFQIDSAQVSLTKDKKKVYITINLTEGEQYTIGKIDLTGEFIVAKATLDKLIGSELKLGAVYSLQAVLAVKQQIENQLSNLGYSKVEVGIDYQLQPQQNTVDLKFNIVPNKKMKVRKLIISGNNLTEDFVIRRMLPQQESTWVSEYDVQFGKEQILRRGYANKVEVVKHAVPGVADQIDLEYKIEERRNMQLSAGVNYNGSEGFGYEFKADIKNFIGTGRDIGASFNKSKIKSAYEFSYFNPYYTIDGIGFGYDLVYQRYHLSKNSKISDYSTDTLGGDLKWVFPLSTYTEIAWLVGYHQTKLTVPNNPSTQITNFVSKHGLRYKELSTSISWNYNSLNRYLFPTKGFSHSLSFKYNLPASNLKYYQLGYGSRWYHPLGKGFVFNFVTDFGYGKAFSGHIYPFFKNYFIGGADSLRGFEDFTVGPQDSSNNPIGGNLLVNLRTSIILPVPFKPELESVIRPSIFLDMGQVYDTTKNSSKQDRRLRYAAGISLAINTPLGAPVVLSLAKPLKSKPGDNKQTFSFSFSTIT